MEYFIRHTNVLEISNADVLALYEEGVIGIHYGSDYEIDPSEMLTPEFYDGSPAAVRSMKYLLDLAKYGGYIWSDYSPVSKTIIGEVAPNSEVFLREYCPTKNEKYFPKGKLFLKCIKLVNTLEIQTDQQLSLRARRPQQGTLTKWHKSNGKIKKILSGDSKVDSWSDLTPDQQEILVYEYLHEQKDDEYQIKYLLMPIGRTLKDVDIYGMSNSGKKVFVQVTNFGENQGKIEALEQYHGESNLLVYAGDVENKISKSVRYLNVRDVYKYFEPNKQFMDLIAS